MENWKVLNSKNELTERRLILLVDLDSVTAIKRNGCKIFTGLSEGTFKVFSNPKAGPGPGCGHYSKGEAHWRQHLL